jgi:predicted metal-binding protein
MDGQQQNNDAFEWSTKENRSISSKWSKSILSLHKKKAKELWQVLENYANVFALNKRELECCLIKEHAIYTQGFPLCHISPNRPSFWEKVEVN